MVAASEIVAAALQDYGRALVVGDSATHGKGTVQAVIDLGGQLPKLKDADRLPDPSTVRRWSSGLDCSQLALSFLSQTVTRVTHWLARGRQVLDQAGPLHRTPLQ